MAWRMASGLTILKPTNIDLERQRRRFGGRGIWPRRRDLRRDGRGGRRSRIRSSRIDPKTMQTKSAYTASQEFASTPVVFEYKGKTLIAAAAIDGSVHLADTANLSTALSVTPSASKGSAPGSLASWQDSDGARWILVAHTGALPAGFTSAGGAVTKGAILAWKLVEEGGKLALKPDWASRDLVSPLTPTVINGVALATSSGEYRTNDGKMTAAMLAARSKRAVIYLLDVVTGKELWNQRHDDHFLCAWQCAVRRYGAVLSDNLRRNDLRFRFPDGALTI